MTTFFQPIREDVTCVTYFFIVDTIGRPRLWAINKKTDLAVGKPLTKPGTLYSKTNIIRAPLITSRSVTYYQHIYQLRIISIAILYQQMAYFCIVIGTLRVQPHSLLSFKLFYNMVGSALFLQRALYTVHCTNTMHSRKLSFAITPAVVSQHCKSLFCDICGNEIRHILLKQFHLITLDINTIKHPCISPCT